MCFTSLLDILLCFIPNSATFFARIISLLKSLLCLILYVNIIFSLFLYPNTEICIQDRFLVFQEFFESKHVHTFYICFSLSPPPYQFPQILQQLPFLFLLIVLRYQPAQLKHNHHINIFSYFLYSMIFQLLYHKYIFLPYIPVGYTYI